MYTYIHTYIHTYHLWHMYVGILIESERGCFTHASVQYSSCVIHKACVIIIQRAYNMLLYVWTFLHGIWLLMQLYFGISEHRIVIDWEREREIEREREREIERERER